MSGAQGSRPSNQPHDDDDSSDREMDADDMRDYMDQDPNVPPTSTANLGPYARFLADMPDWNDMSQANYAKAFEALPRPLPGPSPPDLKIHEAI